MRGDAARMPLDGAEPVVAAAMDAARAETAERIAAAIEEAANDRAARDFGKSGQALAQRDLGVDLLRMAARIARETR
jgi:hypothetical protein